MTCVHKCKMVELFHVGSNVTPSNAIVIYIYIPHKMLVINKHLTTDFATNAQCYFEHCV